MLIIVTKIVPATDTTSTKIEASTSFAEEVYPYNHKVSWIENHLEVAKVFAMKLGRTYAGYMLSEPDKVVFITDH